MALLQARVDKEEAACPRRCSGEECVATALLGEEDNENGVGPAGQPKRERCGRLDLA